MIKYAVATGVALALCLLTLWLHGFTLDGELVDKYRILADAFTIPGILIHDQMQRTSQEICDFANV